MHTFTDTKGRTWTVELTVGTIVALRRRLQLDLLALVEDNCQVLLRLSHDPVLLVDALYVVCAEQAEAAGVSDEQFGRAMGGDVLAAAVAALEGAIVDFFHPSQRPALAAMLAKVREVENRAAEAMVAKLASPELEAWIESRLTAFGAPSSDWPAAPASSPGGTASATSAS